LQFDGTNEHVQISDDDVFSFGNGTSDHPFSISAWVNFNDATSSEIIEKYTTNNYEYWFGTNDQDEIGVSLYDQSAGPAYVFASYTTSLASYEGQWVHLAMTYDGSGAHTGIKIYLNGTNVKNYGETGGGTYVAMENLGAPLRIAYGQAYGFMDGIIDDVRVYNYARTAEQIQQDYNAGVVVHFGE